MHQVQRFPLSSRDAAHQLFNNTFWRSNGRTQEPTRTSAKQPWMPAVDITEQENQFLVVADIPGFTAEDISISVDKRVLTVGGKREEAVSATDDGYSRIERYSGDFERRFTLPESVDIDAVSAKVENGILTLTIPKLKEAAVRKITVQG